MNIRRRGFLSSFLNSIKLATNRIKMTDSKRVVTYETLKQAAFNVSISLETLEELKLIFKTDINSKRKYDCIRNIRDFIDVLERHDALSEVNIKFIDKLTAYCQSNSLKEALQYYCIPEYTDDIWRFLNVYQSERVNDSLKENLQRNLTVHSFENQTRFANGYASFIGILSDEKRKAIYKKLTKELGKDWRNLGRELNITEGEMDNIESQSHDLATRIAKLLKSFEEDHCNDPKQHCLLLCQALDECGRKDLRRGIEKIMSHERTFNRDK